MDAKTEAKFQRDIVEESSPQMGPCYYCGQPADNVMKTGNFVCNRCVAMSLSGYVFCVDCDQYTDGWCTHYKTYVPRTFYSRCNAPKNE